MKGFVKWFDNKKGYGFISDEEGNEHFVHYSNIAVDGFKSLNNGDAVEFELTPCEKGQQATNVRCI